MSQLTNKQIIAIVYKMRATPNEANEFVEAKTDDMAKYVFDIESLDKNASAEKQRRHHSVECISPVPNACIGIMDQIGRIHNELSDLQFMLANLEAKLQIMGRNG